MTKRLLQQLVIASYIHDDLDPKKVDEISGRLTRQDLKSYIRALKLMEQKKKVYIAMPSASLYNTNKKDLESLFSGKDLIFEEDPTLLLGMRVTNDDMVYEMSLKNRLESILDEVDQQYSE